MRVTSYKKRKAKKAEHLCEESGANFSEQFNGIDVIVDVIVEQIWLMERLSTWMVRLLERLSA